MRAFDAVADGGLGADDREFQQILRALTDGIGNFLAGLLHHAGDGLIPNLIVEGATPSQALALANLMGDQWIQDLSDHLENVKIIRWAHWHSHPEYEAVHDQFKWLYESNEKFRAIVDLDIDSFVERAPYRIAPQFMKASRDYIFDECAGKTLQGRAHPNLVILYPGFEIGCLDAIRKGKIENVPHGLNHTRHFRYTFESAGYALWDNS